LKILTLIAIIIFLILLTTACSALDPTTPTIIPTPAPSCTYSFCIRNVYQQLVDKNLMINFDLADQNGEVKFGEDISLKSPINFALYLHNDPGDTYLGGFATS
jgi:hypothetical protein